MSKQDQNFIETQSDNDQDNLEEIIYDGGSYVNALASGMVTKFELKTVPHPQSYKVSWVNFTSIDVKEMCLVLIQFATYSDKIWCDVTMDVGHTILGRPWLYDLDVPIYGHPNFCSFVHDGKKVKLAPLRSAPPPEAKQPDASNSKALNLISPKTIDKEIAKELMIVLVARQVTDDSSTLSSVKSLAVLN